MSLQLVKRASDVRIQEINLSAVITAVSSAVAAIPIISTQGSPNPLLFTNPTDFLTQYGNPNPAISGTIQNGLNYLTEGNQMWAVRVLGAGALYSSVLLVKDSTGAIVLRPVTAGVADPVDTDLSTLVAPNEEAIALFYPINGQGSYGNKYAIAIGSNTVGTPTVAVPTSTATGGQLANGSYTYMVSALSASGESLVSSAQAITISGLPQATATVNLSWTLVPGAIGYRVYGRLSGDPSFGLLYTAGSATNTFVDSGTLTPNTAIQPITDASKAASSPTFTVGIYDTTTPQALALETWTCTLSQGVDSQGAQTELEARINPFSSYIQVASNAPALSPEPTITSVAKTQMAGGNSGAAPTSSDVVNALQVFLNKGLYQTNTFINAGIADPIVGLGLDTLVQARGDSVSLLDTPSAYQKAQQAVDYRNLELNLNSTYSALFNPDTLQADLINGQQLYVSPSGWAAALCARTDRVANPAYSIAGLNRGLLNVLKQRYTYDDGEATLMYDAQVNYLRTSPGQGIALWEQQTLSGQQSALSWLSVRRITNTIKVALYQYLLYALQEQNTDAIRRNIVNGISAYLQTIVNASGLSGFQVICDDSNNPATASNAGVLVVTVILVPIIPIHEIQLQVVISKAGVSFAEVLNTVTGNTQ